MRGRSTALAISLCFGAAGCPSAPPPASTFPSGADAIVALRKSAACGNGVQAEAKIDHFGDQGRVRGDLSILASKEASLRLGVFSFGVAVATLTSDGKDFALADLRNRRFFSGEATACNIARLTSVPIPGHVLVTLLRGQAPILKHAPGSERIAWDRDGYYVLHIDGANATSEDVRFVPHPGDRSKPWSEQRARVLDVLVREGGLDLFHAAMDEHAPAEMSAARADEDAVDEPLLPSGPTCTADLPRTIHVEVPGLGEDVLFRYKHVAWNPPLGAGVFKLDNPGLPAEHVSCE